MIPQGVRHDGRRVLLTLRVWGVAFTLPLTRRRANRLALDLYRSSVDLQRYELEAEGVQFPDATGDRP